MMLEKWYGDVFYGGELHIFYRANLTLGPVAIGYRGCLSNERRTVSRISLGGIPMPCVGHDSLIWPEEDGTNFIWNNAAARPIELWRDRDKTITWDPIVLNGKLVHNGARGYAERLKMNFAPWRLGLKLLKWGRFCGEPRRSPTTSTTATESALPGGLFHLSPSGPTSLALRRRSNWCSKAAWPRRMPSSQGCWT